MINKFLLCIIWFFSYQAESDESVASPDVVGACGQLKRLQLYTNFTFHFSARCNAERNHERLPAGRWDFCGKEGWRAGESRYIDRCQWCFFWSQRRTLDYMSGKWQRSFGRLWSWQKWGFRIGSFLRMVHLLHWYHRYVCRLPKLYQLCQSWPFSPQALPAFPDKKRMQA